MLPQSTSPSIFGTVLSLLPVQYHFTVLEVKVNVLWHHIARFVLVMYDIFVHTVFVVMMYGLLAGFSPSIFILMTILLLVRLHAQKALQKINENFLYLIHTLLHTKPPPRVLTYHGMCFMKVHSKFCHYQTVQKTYLFESSLHLKSIF